MTTVEPFTFEVIQDTLYAVTEEMGAELTRIAYSTIIRESHDCATGITDAQGQTVAQAALTPGHFMTISSATKGVLDQIPAGAFHPATRSSPMTRGYAPAISQTRSSSRRSFTEISCWASCRRWRTT